MPIFTPAFGSVGDFVTVVQLAYEIVRILRDASGSSSEYDILLTEVDTVRITLQAIQPELHSPNIDEHGKLCLQSAFDRCHRILTDIWTKMEMYLVPLPTRRTNIVGRMVRSYKSIRKAFGWVLFDREELEGFRDRLATQVQCIDTILTRYQRYALYTSRPASCF